MFRSLIDDLKHNYHNGNMVTRLIIINVVVFVVTALTKAFAPQIYNTVILEYLAVPAEFSKLIWRPWTFITHMFVHSGGWHLIWNMLMLYWFGRIVGDLLNDRRIWPLYFLGAVVGAFVFIFSYHLFSNVIGARAIGASAGIMAIVAAAGAIAPDYQLRLLFLGDVKLKYIVAVLIFVDILSAGGYANAGGAMAHLGGAALGFLFVYLLRNGTDITDPINSMMARIDGMFRDNKDYGSSRRKSPLTVKHSAVRKPTVNVGVTQPDDLQTQVDTILDKIKASGYESLTDNEKAILFQASKKG